MGVTLMETAAIRLERVSPLVPRLRKSWYVLRTKKSEDTDLLAVLERAHKSAVSSLKQAEDDVAKANASDAELIDSAALTGKKTRYLLDDFLAKMAVEMDIKRQAETEASDALKSCRIRVRNYDDTMHSILDELTVETGPLMQKVVARHPIRLIGFNDTNRRTNNVLGEANDGVSVAVVIVEAKASLVDLKNGLVLDVLVGDPLAADKTQRQQTKDKLHNAKHVHHTHSHLPKVYGHSARIACVFFSGPRLLTGGVDCNVIPSPFQLPLPVLPLNLFPLTPILGLHPSFLPSIPYTQ
jgi:hypothetical protein